MGSERIIKQVRGRNKKLAGMGKDKAKKAKGPDMKAFVKEVMAAGRTLATAGSDTVQKKRGKAMFAKIRKKHGIK
jgi:hypothetical protein